MYELRLTSNARRDLRRLSANIQAQVLSKLERLCDICETYPHRALKGRYRGQFSLRVADIYRIIYTFDRQTQTIEVSRIRHRSVAYKDF